MNNMKIKYSLLLLLAFLIALSCRKKDFDEPPIKEIPEGKLLTIQDLRDMFEGQSVRFTDDYSVYATITMDDRSGNIYRNAYIQDETNAIVIRTNFPGGLFAGDSIRLYLKGTTLSSFNGLLQVDSVDVDENIIKQATQRHFKPQVVTLSELINNDFQSKLVKIENVEFAGSEIGKTYANAAAEQSANRMLIDCEEENQIIVRTSGFADFADQQVAHGNGSIVVIVGEFNGEKQLYIRDLSEVKLNNERCTFSPDAAYLYKDFSDQSITSGGWSNYVVKSTPNAHKWETSDMGSPGNYYAVTTGFQFDGFETSETELWLISPSTNLSSSQSPGLTFKSSTRHDGPAVQLLVSKDYDGSSDPSTQGTWINYTNYATWSPGDFEWTNSGVIPMVEFKNEENVYVAYKYTSTSDDAATWQVDDIIIREY